MTVKSAVDRPIPTARVPIAIALNPTDCAAAADHDGDPAERRPTVPGVPRPIPLRPTDADDRPQGLRPVPDAGPDTPARALIAGVFLVEIAEDGFARA